MVYGKSELQPLEISWLREQTYIRTSFCKNLHAKCYLNEDLCIVTSLNLYEFSQVNNNEMGILSQRSDDAELDRDAYEEAQRIIRISEEVRISMERVAKPVDEATGDGEDAGQGEGDDADKLTTSKLARKLGCKTAELTEKLVASRSEERRVGKACVSKCRSRW